MVHTEVEKHCCRKRAAHEIVAKERHRLWLFLMTRRRTRTHLLGHTGEPTWWLWGWCSCSEAAQTGHWGWTELSSGPSPCPRCPDKASLAAHTVHRLGVEEYQLKTKAGFTRRVALNQLNRASEAFGTPDTCLRRGYLLPVHFFFFFFCA